MMKENAFKKFVGAATVAVVFSIIFANCGVAAASAPATPATTRPAQTATVSTTATPAPEMVVAQASSPATPAPTTAPLSDVDALDRVIREVSGYLNERISRGDKVAFVSARQSFPMLAEYIIENLIENAVNDRSFSVIDRAQLDAVRAELQFQTSGEVSDESVRSLGRIVGAKTIVTVAVSQVGEIYRFSIRALEVESAEIQGQINRNIQRGRTIDALAGAVAHAPARTTAPPPPASHSQSTTTATPAATPARPTTVRPTGAVVTPPGNTLAEQLAFIESQVGRGITYDIVVNSDIELRPVTVSTMGRDITVIIRSANPNNVRTIELHENETGHLLSVDANVTLKLQDIVLKGHRQNRAALVMVGRSATLILNSGAKITGNRNNAAGVRGAGVLVDGGVLEINSGAEIRGNVNVGDRGGGGGIAALNNSTINMFGGTITENTNENNFGGGILISGNSNMTMTDGIISRNRCYYSGGGIYVGRNSTVTMTGGIIAGNSTNIGCGSGVFVDRNEGTFIKRPQEGSDVSGIIYGTTGQNANTSGNNCGHAVYRESNRETRRRNTTLGAYDEISTESSRGWE